MEDTLLKFRWIKFGCVAGILSLASYAAAAFVPLPDAVGYLAAFAFGPLLSIGFVGLYHFISLQKNSPWLQAGTLLAIAGGVTVLLMLCVQQSIFATMDEVKEKNIVFSPELKTGLNAVQLGLDVAWDVLISGAMILVGIGMFGHSRFGKIFPIAGIILGTLLLSFNIYYFPVPPDESGSIDFGPFAALWFLVVFIIVAVSMKWVKEQQG